MSLKTQFGGYTPETELTDSDWTQKFATAALATVKGLGFSFVADETDASDGISYTFSGIISEPGKYVIGVSSEGQAAGINYVDVDGMGADPIESGTNGYIDVGIFVVDAQSISVGDINVDFVDYTKVLLHFDGSDGSTTFTDEAGHTWTAAGDAQIDTAQSKFGGASGLFDGTGDNISTPDHDDFDLGSSDFTIECWFNCVATTGSFRNIAIKRTSPAAADEQFIVLRNTSDVLVAIVSVGSTKYTVTGTTVFTDADNTGWHHLAFVRASDVLKLFIDGVQEGGDVAISGSVNRISTPLFISGSSWQGWIDEFRLSVGIARWTETFTPPASPYNFQQINCGIFVWKLTGLVLDDEYHSVGSILSDYQSINVDNRSVIIGVGGTSNSAATHFWSGIAKRSEQIVAGDAEQSGADRLKVFSSSEAILSVGMDADSDGLDGFWVSASWISEYGFFPSGQCVELSKQTSDELTLLAWNAPPLSADVETLCLIRPTAQSDTMEIGTAIRGNNTLATADAYNFVLYQSVANAQDQVAIIKRDQAVTTVLGTALFAWSLNTNYWMRFRVRGSTLQGRIWQDGSTEPTTWGIEVTDSDVSAAGHVGLFHRFTGSTALIGHFESKVLYSEWPSAVPQNWEVNIRSGAQSNKISFTPRVGPTIDRRRASSRIRTYEVTVPGLTLTQYTAFVDFAETTLEDGTLPFTYTDPFTNEEKTFKFGPQDPLFNEEIMRSPGSDGTDGLYSVSFNAIRLD